MLPKLGAYSFTLILIFAIITTESVFASADPVTTFIVRADSLERAGGDVILSPYLREHSILVGAAVGRLLEVAFQAGEAGDKDVEKENMDFAERLGRLYKETTGSHILLQLVETYKSWTPEQRALRSRAGSLVEEALRARNEGELERSVEIYHQAMALYKKIGDQPSQAVTWGSLGVVHWYRGDMEAVEESYEKALIARRKIEDRILEGKTLNGLGSVHFRTGRYETAIEYYTRAIELRHQTGDLGGLGISLTYRGNTYYLMNRLVEARSNFEAALSILERAGSPGQMLEVLNSIASVYSDMGRLKGANQAYRRAIKIATRTDEPQDEASCRINLASNLRLQGRYREALAELELAQKLLLQKPEPVKTTLLYRERGLTYMNMGEMDRGREDLLTSLKIAESLSDPFHHIEALINLGYLYQEIGAYEEGLTIGERAKILAEESGNSRLVREAFALLGEMEHLLGRNEKALQYWQLALERDRIDGAEAKTIEDELSVAGSLAAMGREVEAREAFRNLQPLVRQSGRSDLDCVLHFGIGHTYEKENLDSASFHYERALGLIEQSREAIGGAEIRTGFLSGERRYFYEEVARFYASQEKGKKKGSWSARAFLTIERAKARGLLDLLETSLLSESSAAEETLLDSLYQLEIEAPENKEEHLRLEKLYLAEREKRLKESLGPLGPNEAVTELPRVQRALARGTVLLEYALGDTTSLLWVVDRKGHDLYQIPNRRAIGHEVKRLRDALGEPGAGDAVLRKTARNLYKTLVLPAERRLSKAKKLVIVPDGILYELPFEMLLTREPDGNAGWEEQPFLARSFAPLYAPSASIYLKLLKSKRRGDYRVDLLALGDPDFALLPRGPERSGEPLPDLPYSRSEVLGIGSYLESGRKRIILGEEASEAQLKIELRKNRPRILHLATHGLVDPLEPISSSVVLCPDTTSGEDGYLHTLEILSMPLEVGLVVVSACESGLGRLGRGEGVVGLSRAFVASGARGVVASLWVVSDESTAALMKKFYENMLTRKKPARTALNAARLVLMENPRYAHPFYWSPFIVIGTDRTPW